MYLGTYSFIYLFIYLFFFFWGGGGGAQSTTVELGTYSHREWAKAWKQLWFDEIFVLFGFKSFRGLHYSATSPGDIC